LGNWSRSSDLRDYTREIILEVVMPSQRDRARVRLEQETPVSDHVNLHELQAQAAAIADEAQRRSPSDPDELVWTVVDRVGRNYFQHIQKRRNR
jgi:hypothetical protein